MTIFFQFLSLQSLRACLIPKVPPWEHPHSLCTHKILQPIFLGPSSQGLQIYLYGPPNCYSHPCSTWGRRKVWDGIFIFMQSTMGKYQPISLSSPLELWLEFNLKALTNPSKVDTNNSHRVFILDFISKLELVSHFSNVPNSRGEDNGPLHITILPIFTFQICINPNKKKFIARFMVHITRD